MQKKILKIVIFGYFLPKIELWTPKKGKKSKNQNSGGIKLETTTHSLCI